MPDQAYHMVHYREFGIADSEVTDSLEHLTRNQLTSAGDSGTARWESIADRVMGIGDGTGFELVLNRVADLSSAVFGEMCLIHPKGVQALLTLTAHKHQLSTLTLAEIYDLTEQGAPKGKHYVRGLAYFLVVGNHLFFIRTQSLTLAHLQSYLEWLLKASPGAIPTASVIELESKFDRSATGGNIGDIKALRVSGPSFPQMRVTPTTDEQVKERATTRKVAEKFVQFGQAYEIAQAVLGEARAKSLAESLGPKERLVVDATVKVRGTRTESSKARLKDLASELDSLTDGKITVEGKDGKFEDKDVILRTNMPFDLDTTESSLLNYDNVADQLQKVYARFVEDGKIKA